MFLGYQFQSKSFNAQELIATFEGAIRDAEVALRKVRPEIRLQPRREALQLGAPLGQQILDMVLGSSAGVFEISDMNPNVYFELGLAKGNGLRHPILLFNGAMKAHKKIGSDVRDLLRIQYRKNTLANQKFRIAKAILKAITRKLADEARADPWNALRQVWVGRRATRSLVVVCPELPRNYRPAFADPNSPEFVELAKVGDADALVELLELLPRVAPNAEIIRVTSKEVARSLLQKDLIVLGGPDFNEVAEEVMDASGIPFEYGMSAGRSCFRDKATGSRYELETSTSGSVRRDYGLFSRIQNPWNSRAITVVVGGLQTFGVRGAVRAFCGSPQGRSTARAMLRKLGTNSQFAALIPVSVTRSLPTPDHVSRYILRTPPW